MNPAVEVALIANREVKKNFRSVKGILLAVLTIMGGVAFTFILSGSEKVRSKIEQQAKLQQQMQEQMQQENLPPDGSGAPALDPLQRNAPPRGNGSSGSHRPTTPGKPPGEASKPAEIKVTAEDLKKFNTAVYEEAGLAPSVAAYLGRAPMSLVMVLFVSVWLSPLLVSLLGFDGVSSDLQYRAYRFWATRSRRWSFLLGKFLGLFVSVAITTLAMNFIMWIAIAARGEEPFFTCVSWGFQLWMRVLPAVAGWMGIVTLISASVRVPILSLLTTFAAFFAVFVIWIIGVNVDNDFLKMVCPYGYVTHLLDTKIDQYLIGLMLSLGSVGVWIGGAVGIFRWRDV